MSSNDNLQKFMFDNAAVRGELVELSDTWQHIRTRRAYPAPVQTMLGQMLAAAALLSANLKFDGTMILQLHGDGPVRLLVVECNSELEMRATAKLAPDAEIALDAQLNDMVNCHGKGRFVITLDPNSKLPGRQAYQGVVPLDGDDIATVLEHYMLRSEQLDTKLVLAADDHVVRGLLLQKLPHEGGTKPSAAATVADAAAATAAAETPVAEGTTDPGINLVSDEDLDTWQRATMLAGTLHEPELLTTPVAQLLHRLFWEETLRVFEPKHPQFRCTCSRERVGNMLKMLGKPEIDSALEEMETLGIDCDFCGQHYAFDRVDCAQLFANDTPVAAMLAASEVKH